MASIFTFNMRWWNTSQYNILATSKGQQQVETASSGGDGRSSRLRLIFQGIRGLPTYEESPAFVNFISAVHHPLDWPTASQMGKDCRQFERRAQDKGIDEEALFEEEMRNNGTVQGEDSLGSHAIIVTGYNDIDKVLEFRNSWGEDWKDAGYGYMSYSYFRRFLLSYWYDELPIVAYKPDDNGRYHTSGHPLDTHPI